MYVKYIKFKFKILIIVKITQVNVYYEEMQALFSSKVTQLKLKLSIYFK